MAGTSLKTEEYPLVSKTQNYLFQIFLMVFDRFKPTWITIQERIHYTHIATFDHPTVKSISMTSIEFKWPIRCHSDQTGPSGNMYRGQYGLLWYHYHTVGGILDNHTVTWNPISSKDFKWPICGHQMTVNQTTRPSTDTSSAYMDTS